MVKIYGRGKNTGQIEIRSVTPEGGVKITRKNINTGQVIEEKEGNYSQDQGMSDIINQKLNNRNNRVKIRR